MAVNRWVLCGLLVAAPLALAAEPLPMQGTPIRVFHGFFTEVDVGGFFTLGGESGASTPQSYVQLSVGTDLGPQWEVAARIALGSNSFNCFSDVAGGACIDSESFSMTFLEATLGHRFAMGRRLYFMPRLQAGFVSLNPSPARKDDGSSIRGGLAAGAGVGVEYFTALEHFSIGAEVAFRYVPVAKIPSVAIYPRLKYTF